MKAHADDIRARGRRVAIASWTEGSRERLESILKDHDVARSPQPRAGTSSSPGTAPSPAFIVLGLEEGFETDDFVVIAEQDILGDRMVRRGRRNKKASDFISELSALTPAISSSMSTTASAASRG